MAKLSLSDRVKGGEGAGGGAQSRDAAPSHQQEPAEMGIRHLVRAPPRHLLSLEGVLGMSNPEEAFGGRCKTQWRNYSVSPDFPGNLQGFP